MQRARPGMRMLAAAATLVACKGNKAPPEDKRAPAQAPVALASDAAIDAPAPSGPCFTLPFGMDAERAGIRRVAHRTAVEWAAPRENVKVDDAIVLPPGKPTLVKGLRAYTAQALVVPSIGADALVATAKIDKEKVTLTAPPHLEGAMIAVQGSDYKLARTVIGERGRRGLELYAGNYVLARLLADPLHDGLPLAKLMPVAVIADDLDADGAIDLVALSSATARLPETGGHRKPELPPYELGVLWKQSEKIAFAPLPSTDVLYVVPPALSGGKPLIVSQGGARIAIEGDKLVKLPTQYFDDGACLQTSATEPASFRKN